LISSLISDGFKVVLDMASFPGIRAASAAPDRF